jgi:hypothetical protein
MKKNISLTVFACVVVTLSLGLPFAQAQDGESPIIPVSGTFDYTPTRNYALEVGGSTFIDATEDEIWSGDFEGTSVAPFRVVASSTGIWDAWLLAEFEGAVLGEYEGTMVIMSTYRKNAATAEWYGEWMILSGTGDLATLQGHGVAWGPGFRATDPEASPDIYYSGEVVFVEPASE